jgi:cobalamin biosynthesis protein CobT
MMVLSDGMPAGARNRRQEHRYLRESVKRITDAGIEVIGIGINTSAVTQFYPDNIVVRDIDALADVALVALTEVLTRTRQEHSCIRLTA